VGQPAAKRQAESPAKHEGNAPAKRAGEAPAEPKKAVYSGEPQKPAVAEHKPPAEKDAAAEAAPEAPGGGLDFMSMVFVFMLATFIGIGVIRRVSRLLHTPLMSLTNAISAIAVVGSLMLAGGKEYPLGYKIIGAVAMFASMTNIISGFLITDRMLKMFKTRQGGKA
jgi:NAD(P) transhydrogenase subunit alpha